jgi:two-component system chemotaxis sensor kinase CheA
VSAELGKEVALELVGADTEIDKSVAEQIGDPLMHLVRNALDHGLETPEERVAAGKPARGILRLSAAHEAGGVLITIEDDGHGIRRDRVLARAIERGILPADAQPSDEEIDNLIFEPGFSTAEQVTNLSGRGVGMDVVRRNIEALRGSVRIESRTGEGTRVRIRLPLTLAIIDGFLVRVGETAFALPLDHVVECVEHGASHVTGTGIMTLRDSPLPVIDLASLFEIERDAQARGSVVVVRQGDAQVGIAVDHLLGEFQAVIKPLGAVFKHIRCIGGSTILGSGEVGLVMDVPALMQYAAEHCSNDLAVEGPAVQAQSGLALAS